MTTLPISTTFVDDSGKSKTVLLLGPDGGPNVILLHELAGVSSSVVALAESLSHGGYRVHMPVLLGRSMLANAIRVCLSREFTVFAAGKSSPIADWLRAYCGALGTTAVVVGMCVTGGIVLSVLWEPGVVAGVMAQPSLPLRWGSRLISRGELGASYDDVEMSVNSGKRMLVLAFGDDRLCPLSRIERVQELWNENGAAENLTVTVYPGRAHSTLTADHRATMVPPPGSGHSQLLEFLATVDWDG